MKVPIVSSVAIILASAAIFATAGRAQEARLTFELEDAAGKTVKSSGQKIFDGIGRFIGKKFNDDAPESRVKSNDGAIRSY